MPFGMRTNREPPLSASLGRCRTSVILKLPVSSTAERECVKNSSPVPRWLSCHCFASSACFSSLLLPPPNPGIHEVMFLRYQCVLCEKMCYATERWLTAGRTYLRQAPHSGNWAERMVRATATCKLHHRCHAGTKSQWLGLVSLGQN